MGLRFVFLALSSVRFSTSHSLDECAYSFVWNCFLFNKIELGVCVCGRRYWIGRIKMIKNLCIEMECKESARERSKFHSMQNAEKCVGVGVCVCERDLNCIQKKIDGQALYTPTEWQTVKVSKKTSNTRTQRDHSSSSSGGSHHNK